jgi:hypothetical protein
MDSRLEQMPWHQNIPSSSHTGSTASRKKRVPSSVGTPLGGSIDFDFYQSNASDPNTPSRSSVYIPKDNSIDSIHDSQIDNECLAFLNYTKNLIVQAQTDSVFLFDLLQDHSSKSTAAQAFYNVLMLSTQNLIKVQQREAYGDIKITPS